MAVKKKVTELKEKNEDLIQIVHSDNPPVLPFMKANGRIKTAVVRLTSSVPGPKVDRSPSKLKHAKSALVRHSSLYPSNESEDWDQF